MLDLEDSGVSLGAAPADAEGEEVTQQPAKRLGRLRKAAQVLDKENATANFCAPAEDSPPRPAASEHQASERPAPADDDAEAAPASPVLAPAASSDAGTEAAAAPSPGGQVRCLPSCAWWISRTQRRGTIASPVAPHFTPQEESYFDEEDELEERFARRRKGGAAAGSAAASPAASGGELLLLV